MDARELIRQARTTHIIVFAGDGHNRPAERLFDTGSGHESQRIAELLLQLLDERKL